MLTNFPMKAFPAVVCFVFFFFLCFSGREVEGNRRRKRSLVGLAKMLQLVTGRNPLDFVGYGNWCGLGGGGPPVDNIDRCCSYHDKCYDKATEKVCFDRRPHLARYEWTDIRGKIYCSKANSNCGNFSCHCDRTFAYCVGRYVAIYDSRNKKRKSRFLEIVFD